MVEGQVVGEGLCDGGEEFGEVGDELWQFVGQTGGAGAVVGGFEAFEERGPLGPLVGLVGELGREGQWLGRDGRVALGEGGGDGLG